MDRPLEKECMQEIKIREEEKKENEGKSNINNNKVGYKREIQNIQIVSE